MHVEIRKNTHEGALIFTPPPARPTPSPPVTNVSRKSAPGFIFTQPATGTEQKYLGSLFRKCLMMKIHLYKSIAGYMAIYSMILKQSQSKHETTRQEIKQVNNKRFFFKMLTWPFFIFSFQILYPVLSRRLTSKPFALLGLVNLPWKLETMTILLPAPTFSNLSPPAFLRTHIPRINVCISTFFKRSVLPNL